MTLATMTDQQRLALLAEIAIMLDLDAKQASAADIKQALAEEREAAWHYRDIPDWVIT